MDVDSVSSCCDARRLFGDGWPAATEEGWRRIGEERRGGGLRREAAGNGQERLGGIGVRVGKSEKKEKSKRRWQQKAPKGRSGALHNGAALGGCRTEHTSERKHSASARAHDEVDARAIAKWGRQGEEETAEEEEEIKKTKTEEQNGRKKKKEKGEGRSKGGKESRRGLP